MKDSITLYSSPTCPICKMLKMELDKHHIEYNINQNSEEQLALGIKQLPVLCVNGEMLQAPAARAWIKEH